MVFPENPAGQGLRSPSQSRSGQAGPGRKVLLRGLAQGRVQRQCPRPAGRAGQEHVRMTAIPPQSLVTEGARSLEVR